MIKQGQVTLHLNDDGQSKYLSIKTKDGQEYRVEIFSGGGYVNQIWLRTEEEIEKAKMKAIEIDHEWRNEMIRKSKERQNKKWWQLWK